MIKETLPSQELLEKELRKIWNIALEEYPELSILETENLIVSQKDFLQYTAGEFVASNEQGRSAVKMILGNIQHLDSLRNKRKVALEIIANKLGIASEHIEAKILNLLIFLHEMGHGLDYINNYLKNPIYEKLGWPIMIGTTITKMN